MELKTLQSTPPWEWPQDASETLLEVLTDERADDSDRILAAELAGDYVVINEELANALLSILQNGQESEFLRGKAAISLGPVLEHADTVGFEDSADALITESTFRRIKKSLLKLFLDTDVPKELRRPIFEASVRAPQEWHQDAIQAAYTGADEDWRLTAVFAMRWVRGFEDQILEALDSENQEVHYQAVCAAGNWGLDAAWPHVLELVTAEDTDKSLRLDTLFLTLPVSWKGVLAQYAGRLHRLHDRKKGVIIYDYVDSGIAMLERMHKRRLSGYKAIGYETEK